MSRVSLTLSASQTLRIHGLLGTEGLHRLLCGQSQQHLACLQLKHMPLYCQLPPHRSTDEWHELTRKIVSAAMDCFALSALSDELSLKVPWLLL